MSNNTKIDFEDTRTPTELMELFADKQFYRGKDNAFSTKHIVNMTWENLTLERKQDR